MAHIEKRGKKYRAVFMRKGQKYAKSFDSKVDALIWADQMQNGSLVRENARATGQLYAPVNMREVLQEYRRVVTPLKKSPDNEYRVIDALLKNVPWMKTPFITLSTKTLVTWRDRRLQSVKGSTLKRQMDVVNHALRIATDEWEWDVPVEQFRKLKIKVAPPSAIRRIKQEELDRFVEFSQSYSRNDYLVPVIHFALGTALRRKEIADLTWGEVDLENSRIHVSLTKTDYPRVIPIIANVRKILEAMEPGSRQPDEPVFPCSWDAIKCAFARVKRRAGTTFRFHDLRHESISRFFEAGLSPIEVASISGHRTLKTLMRYSHADVDALLKKLEGMLS